MKLQVKNYILVVPKLKMNISNTYNNEKYETIKRNNTIQRHRRQYKADKTKKYRIIPIK